MILINIIIVNNHKWAIINRNGNQKTATTQIASIKAKTSKAMIKENNIKHKKKLFMPPKLMKRTLRYYKSKKW